MAGSPYPVTPSAAVGTGLSNYTIAYVNGQLTVTPAPPTITGEQVILTYHKHNKRGKPIGEPVVSFVFQFSTAMNLGTAGNANNYQVDWVSTKRVKKKVVQQLHPVTVQSATYRSSDNSFTLTTAASKKRFAKGGQVTVISVAPNGVSSASGVFLAAPTVFTILPKATRITT